MRKLIPLVVFLCASASAHAADTSAWCDGKDRLTLANGHFYLNGQVLPNNTVTDATEEDMVAFEYDDRLFMPCKKSGAASANAAEEPTKWCASDGTVITRVGDTFILNGTTEIDIGDLAEGGPIESFSLSYPPFFLEDKQFKPCPYLRPLLGCYVCTVERRLTRACRVTR